MKPASVLKAEVAMKAARARNSSHIRLRADDKKYVQEIARELKCTVAEVLHHAVELLKRERQLQHIRETYLNLNNGQLAEIGKESRLFDRSAGDRLR
jgi:predicted transcriptional regulator